MTIQQMILALGMIGALVSQTVLVADQTGGTGARAPAPKPWPPEQLADGQPDVQGLWIPVLGGTVSLTNPMNGGTDFERRVTGTQVRNPSRVVDPPDGQVPYQPWAAARQKQQAYDYEHVTRPEHLDTQHLCLIPGVPRLYYNPRFKIIQPAGSIVFVWDDYHAYRVIPLDGRPHVGPNLKLWMGDARGHWEGRTLVVDNTNLNAKFRLTFVGDFFSDKAHVVERMTFIDANTMNYEATIDDPTVFTRPWTLRVAERRTPDDELWEYACHEGESSAERMLLNADPGKK